VNQKLKELELKYEEWFINNNERASLVEKLGLGFLLVSPFRGDSELFSESLYSTMYLFTALNDYIWLKYSHIIEKNEDDLRLRVVNEKN